MACVIRSATPADEPLLREMLYHAVYVPQGEPPPPREILDDPSLTVYTQGWGRAGDMGVIAVDEQSGEPIGAAWLRLLSGEGKGYGYIDDQTPELSIAVRPGWRGRGIGSRMLDELLTAAAVRYRAVSLSVSRPNPAVRLYERAGFQVVTETHSSFTMICGM